MGGDRSDENVRWTLDGLLEAYPWDERVRQGVEPLEFFFSVEVDEHVSSLWERLADTSRLNRAIGVTEMHFEEHGTELRGTSVTAGLSHAWVEEPWNWITGSRMYAERSYASGFARHSRVRYELVAAGDKTVMYAYLGFLPRNWLYRWILRLGMRDFADRVRGALRAEAPRQLGAAGNSSTQASRVSPGVLARLDAIEEALTQRDVFEEGLDRLLHLVRCGDDMDVHRLQVRKLAHEWKIAERKLLHLFLHATRVGLLSLSWDVICPHCRGPREERSTLGAVPNKASCEPCALEFGTDGPNAIEITFRIHPSIRDVPKQMFCSAQTAERRHVLVQQVLAPGEEREVETLLDVGRFRMRTSNAPSQHAYLDVGVVEDSLDEMARPGAGPIAWRASRLPKHRRRASRPVLRLSNDTEALVTFIVEDVNWADEALRPSHLFCYQSFRDLFSEEYIGADVHLGVGEQVIMFTDIVGSTKLYLDRGDPQAFAAVRRHFTEVFEVVDDHEGAVVKTIGDATMAAFNDSVQALAAARALHAVFPPGGDGDIRLRISMNVGVCIAVNLNSNIDYFGNAVNLAAKLQLVAGAGDVVLSEEVWAAPGLQAYVEAEGLEFERVTFDFDALDRTVGAHRLATVDDASGRRQAG